MKCIECPFHKIIPDPDPHDWFNADDEALVCQKSPKEPDTKSQHRVDKCGYRAIDVALRPYQTKNVEVPDWCPISLQTERDKTIKKILDGEIL